MLLKNQQKNQKLRSVQIDGNYYFHAAVDMLHYMRQMVYLPLKERLNDTCPQCGSASIIYPKVWTKAYQDSLYV